VILKAIINENVVKYDCDCPIFATNLFAETPTCLHVRLMKEMFNAMSGVSESNINTQKIKRGQLYVEQDVIQLPSKSSVDRFSVALEMSCEFVTLFNVAHSNKNVVKCHSSLCRINKGSTRNVDSLHKTLNLCPHLLKFRSFYLTQVRMSDTNVEDAYESDDDENEYTDIPDVLPDKKVFIPRIRCVNVFFVIYTVITLNITLPKGTTTRQHKDRHNTTDYAHTPNFKVTFF